MGLPRISNYGKYSSDNYGAHTLCVEMGPLTVWFSYQTPIAFCVRGTPIVVRRNDWGPTTGKHLAWIDGGRADSKRERVPSEVFERLWNERVEPILNPVSIVGG